jgi:hypothetical protein
MFKQQLRAWSLALLTTVGGLAGAAPASAANRNANAVERFTTNIKDPNLKQSPQPFEGVLYDGSKIVVVENESCDTDYALYVKNSVRNGRDVATIKAVALASDPSRDKVVQAFEGAADLSNYIFSSGHNLSAEWLDVIKIEADQIIVDMSAAANSCGGP